MPTSMPWWRSVAVKSCLIAFVATHIPLLGLIAVVVLQPQWLSPLGVLLSALAFTLAATAFVLAVLWRLFRPLRQAADGLHGFMAEGRLSLPGAAGGDEVGRLVGVLVQSLAHLDRGRAALLDAGAFALKESAEAVRGRAPQRGWMGLVDVDQWDSLDRHPDLRQVARVQRALMGALEGMLGAGEMVVPWGRGRFLVLLDGSGADARERLERLCAPLQVEGVGQAFTMTAAVEAQSGGPRGWGAVLQRLERKLFALRAAGRRAVVA